MAACNDVRLTPDLRAMAAIVSPATTVCVRGFAVFGGVVRAEAVADAVGVGLAWTAEISSGVGLPVGAGLMGASVGEFFCAAGCAV